MVKRFCPHAHTYYSNIRILDAIADPKELINKAIELGMSGIAITEHGNVCSAPVANFYAEEIAEKYPDFKVALGCEIYLTDTREQKQDYYHAVLIARDTIGHQMIRELSSIAWMNSYYDRGMERVPTLRSEIEDAIKKYGKGHMIMTQSCLGGRVNKHLSKMIQCEKTGDKVGRKENHKIIVDFMKWADEWFGDDFYLEIAPAPYPEQIEVNSRMMGLSKAFNKKIVIGDDAHRVNKEDYEAHKAFLNSQMGEREDIDNFYLYTYLQSEEEVKEHIKDTGLDYDELAANSQEIYNKLENFSLRHKQHVPQVEVKNYPIEDKNSHKYNPDKYPVLDELMHSDNPQERYWINYCQEKLEEKDINKPEYLAELEEEARIQKVIGEKLETCIFSYPIFLQYYIDLIWDCGSTVGVGRGSSVAGLNHYLLGLTQVDPLAEGLPYYWRFLNDERVELPDIDLDFCPDKRADVFAKIREERGELGLIQVCTFGTMTAKSAVQSAMRGYRSDKHPNGIDNDIAQYATSLIPSERGFTWPLSDVIYGNEEKNRKPITEFVKVIKQYPGLLETILKVEGCVSRRGTHASGVLFLEKGHEYDEGAIMRSPDGSLVTQYDLHSAEACGAVKYDFLLTEVQSIITQAIKILQEHNEIEPELTLRQAYDKYIHPTVLPLDDEQLWDDLAFKDIPHKFQFDSTVGSQTVKTLRPHSAKEMADANSIMRLMAPDTWDETPTERYARMKNDMSQWYKEMDKWGLTKEEQKVLEPHYLPVYASPCQQEQLMLILMDENICGFSLKDANAARKIVAKKQLSKIPDLKAKILETASSENLGKYIWETAVEPQCGYSFSILHSTVYSYIGLQTVYLATHWNKIYWDCACMQIEGGIENDSTTNYDKIAKAVCAASTNVNISPIDINKSGYLFEPDVENNTILYGMKALVGINGDMINDIISHRPYSSFEDFCSKVKCTKNTLVPLIKSGAFDQFDERKNIMEKYIWSVCNPKKRITMQNFAGLLDAGLLPDDIDFEKRVFNFTRSLKKFCKQGDKYYLQPKHEAFLQKNFDIDPQVDKDGNIYITVDSWKKVYDEAMKPAKKYISGRKEELLQEYNQYLFNKEWDKYAEGDYSAWEMASLGYYYHEHELAHIDNSRYGITSYKNIPEVPVVEKTFKKGNKVIPIFKTYRIAGTVIAKDDAKSTVTLLTTDSGVVNVKMSREYYARLAKQISKVKPDGTKQVVEKSWFGRGTMLVCNGYRRSGQFACKSYKHSNSHQVYKIIGINGKTINMTYLRAGEINEE